MNFQKKLYKYRPVLKKVHFPQPKKKSNLKLDGKLGYQ